MKIDRRLLTRIGRGDAEALAELYDEHAGLLALRLRSRGASTEEAEDILQETFLDVWRSAESFRAESEVGGWLWGIAQRKYLMLVRGEIRLRRREKSVGPQAVQAGDEGRIVDLAVSTEESLRELSPDLQSAFRAVAIEGLSTKEASNRLGIPEGTVKSRVSRARRALKEDLR